MDLNQRHQRVDASHFAMTPRADIPRSTFLTSHTHKTTFNAGLLIPFHVEEVLPADVHKGQVTIFARLATPVFPIMDNFTAETFFFFVPTRLLWANWRKFQGERDNPGDSISFTIPQMVSPAGGYAVGSVQDYMGLPVAGQMAGGSTYSHSTLPIRAYALIYDQWFRDQNLQNSVAMGTGDGPDSNANGATPFSRNKKHDYFTSCLPWPLKGGVDVTLPLTGNANVLGLAAFHSSVTAGNPPSANETGGGVATGWAGYMQSSTNPFAMRTTTAVAGTANPLVVADMSTVTGATINALRIAFQTQRLLERDARGGTRYTEILRNHFGVIPEDSRLQRPEYIGGGRTQLQTSAIPQTSATGLTGGSSPIGSLGAAATIADTHSYTLHATEHGYIVGLIHVGADLTYYQGVHRMWSRLTRYDFYMPVFAFLGEQVVRNDEIYVQGSSGGAADTAAFGYQERWAEYRHYPSRITGLFRETSSGQIASWHAAQKFTALPVLNNSFIVDAPPMTRVLAAGAAADKIQVLMDSFFRIQRTRAMPTYSVPGNIDRF